MSRFNILIITLLLAISLAGCKSQPSSSGSSPSRTGQSGDSALTDDTSLPIDNEEMRELTEADAGNNASAQRELAFLRRYKIGQSFEDARKSTPSEVKLKTPTSELPAGELPDDQAVVEFEGKDLSGYLYFKGTPQALGKLVMVEVFTDDKKYQDAAGKRRIRAFNSLLGKPARLSKEEDDDGSPLYEADWRESNQIIRYADLYEWGSSISLVSADSE
jgi:hypothetical protein